VSLAPRAWLAGECPVRARLWTGGGGRPLPSANIEPDGRGLARVTDSVEPVKLSSVRIGRFV